MRYDYCVYESTALNKNVLQISKILKHFEFLPFLLKILQSISYHIGNYPVVTQVITVMGRNLSILARTDFVGYIYLSRINHFFDVVNIINICNTHTTYLINTCPKIYEIL